MMYPLVTDLAADGVPVAVTCRVLGFSKQGYYRWRSSPLTDRDWADAHLVNATLDIHDDDPAVGYRFIADELPEKGIMACEKKGPALVQGPRHLVRVPQEAWMKSPLAVAALENAVRSRRPAGTVAHSDRGSQFRSRRFVESLRHHGLAGSMGRVGACADNAAMESFFPLLQKILLDRQRWLTGQELRLAITTWIERSTTAGDGKDGWENSRRSNMKQSTGPRSQRPKTPSQQKPGQSRPRADQLVLSWGREPAWSPPFGLA